MNKVIRDGKVAVIYHHWFGSGWYTNCWIKELLFDPKLVELILHPNFENNRCRKYKLRQDKNYKFDEEFDKRVEEYFNEVNMRKYIIPHGNYKGYEFSILDKNNIYELYIRWIPEGKLFTISNYDGKETITTEDDEFKFIKA